MKEVIAGLPKEKWNKAFKEAIQDAIDKDYFSDILFFDLYPDAPRETDKDYEKLWNNVEEAIKEFFGEDDE